MGRHSNAPSRSRKTQVLPNVFGLFSIVLSGCHTDGCDFSGLKEMAAKEPRSVDFPGDELGPVTGFRPLHALGRNGELQAIAGINGGGDVVIVPADGTESCTVTTLPEGASESQRLPGVLEDMLAVLESPNDNGFGALSLRNADCERIGTEFANAQVVAHSERLVPLRWLIVENSDELVAVDADNRERHLIDRDVSLASVLTDTIAVLAGGTLVIRDMGLDERARFGTDVTEVAFGRDGGAIAYVDGGRVNFLASPEAEPARLDDNACGLGFADQATRAGDAAPRFLSYYSPCEDTRLVVYDLDRDVRIEVGAAASSRAAARVLEVNGERVPVVFFEQQLPDSSGAPPILAVAIDGEAPLTLGAGSLKQIGRASTNGVPAWLDPGTDESRIALVSGPEASGVEALLRGVSDFEVATYPERALVAGSSGRSSLIAVEGYSEPTVIAEGAPGVGRGTVDLALFGSDSEGDVGTLQLVRASERAPVEIADEVAISTVNLAFSGESIFFLGDYEPQRKAGELCMQILRNGDRYCEPDVVSFRTFFRPKRAVAYVKSVGTRMRLFWATVQ